MTIADQLLINPDFDIYSECELEFANPSDANEAAENLQWVLDNEPTLQALGVVVCSYYGDTINWERM